AFVQLRHYEPGAMRVSGELPQADRIMNQTMFLGTYPGLTVEMIDHMVNVICEFAEAKGD
ncbi:hypothetical protein N8967_05035, partial [Akkermansiaceae bacterium]|nr:hypothetical protein [Akkermansiaceae bacterium]